MRMRTPSVIPSFLLITIVIKSIIHLQSRVFVAAQIINEPISTPSPDLNDLTDKQLEEICTSRGFELVKDSDKNTGQPVHYSHQDYVDAARQCLEIEAEMERIIKENPNLLQEIEEESRRLTEEKIALEEKLKQTQNMIDERKKSTDDVDSSNVGDSGARTTENDELASNSKEVPKDSTRDIHSTNRDSTTGENGTRLRHDLSGYSHQDPEVVDLDVDSQEDSTLYQAQSSHVSAKGVDDSNGDSDEMNESPIIRKVQSSVLSALDMMKNQRLRLTDEFQRISSSILPDHLRKYLTEILRPLSLILQSTAQTILSLIRRYFIVLLEGVRRKIDTTLDGLTTNK